MKTTDTVLVCFDYTRGKDKGILIVGRKNPRRAIDIINAFQGEEAEELYNKLITRKNAEENKNGTC